MAQTKQTVRKAAPTPGLATYQGGVISSSSMESSLSSSPENNTKSSHPDASSSAHEGRRGRKRKCSEWMNQPSLERVSATRKSHKVAIEYTTDESEDEQELWEPLSEFTTGP